MNKAIQKMMTALAVCGALCATPTATKSGHKNHFTLTGDGVKAVV